MNSDLLISLLVQSNWLFPVGWILLLATAFVISFPEKTFADRILPAWRHKSSSGPSRPRL
jgi:hypothetical protein